MANGDPYGIDPVTCCASGICCNRSKQRAAMVKILSTINDDALRNDGAGEGEALTPEQREQLRLSAIRIGEVVADFLLANHLTIMPEYVAATFRLIASGGQHKEERPNPFQGL